MFHLTVEAGGCSVVTIGQCQRGYLKRFVAPVTAAYSLICPLNCDNYQRPSMYSVFTGTYLYFGDHGMYPYQISTRVTSSFRIREPHL
jgi:hypothetical protein